jgi:hypothetical protein
MKGMMTSNKQDDMAVIVADDNAAGGIVNNALQKVSEAVLSQIISSTYDQNINHDLVQDAHQVLDHGLELLHGGGSGGVSIKQSSFFNKMVPLFPVDSSSNMLPAVGDKTNINSTGSPSSVHHILKKKKKKMPSSLLLPSKGSGWSLEALDFRWDLTGDGGDGGGGGALHITAAIFSTSPNVNSKNTKVSLVSSIKELETSCSSSVYEVFILKPPPPLPLPLFCQCMQFSRLTCIS